MLADLLMHTNKLGGSIDTEVTEETVIAWHSLFSLVFDSMLTE